ncbi:hypothetical protein FHS27_003213 [Rhodopirellula rubra]|uniref:Uncharacterized protein n=1 Tax=Aporhodopirellula rubra TaxID=980271 RepID=A0A7W5E167_9BACT|nr:hypothetical protein [Aporhodopirellula rubra]MBB3207392.1 hypothetical protein [Aporhodopirellula rubra]
MPTGGAVRPSAPVPATPPTQPAYDPFANLPSAGSMPSPGSAGGGMPFGSPGAGGPGRAPQSVNPYSVPRRSAAAPRAGSGTLRSGRSAVLYNIPAIIMIIWGSLVICMVLFQLGSIVLLIASGAVKIQQIDMPVLAGKVAGQLVMLAIQGSVIAGGVAMVQRTRLRAARSAAVISTIPCFGCFIFPIGIWACVLLFSEQAERDFS